LFRELISTISHGDHIDVITTKPFLYDSYSVDSISEERGVNYFIRRVDIPKFHKGFIGQMNIFRAYCFAVLKHTRRQKYDLVYTSTARLFTSVLAQRIAKKKRIPLYLDVRDIFVEGITEVLKKHRLVATILMPVLRRIENYAFGQAEHINLVSNGFEPYFAKYTKPDYTFFTNGIDDVFLGVEPAAGATQHDKTVITYAGNLGIGQSIEEIVPPLARELGEGYLLRVIGDGRQKTLLEERLAAENLTNVELIAPVSRDNLLKYYRDSDFLFLHLNDCAPTERSLPSKLFEYSVYNIPIVAGVKGYAATFIRQELPGCLVFNPGDYVTAAKEIETYKSEQIDRSAFIKKYARRTIMKQMVASILSTVNPDKQ
jgi:hypothetical protein